MRGGDDSVGIGDGDDGVDVHGGDGDDSDGGLVVVKSVTALDLERCLVVGRTFQIRRHQVQLQQRPDPPDSWSLPPSSSSRGFLKYNSILICIQD